MGKPGEVAEENKTKEKDFLKAVNGETKKRRLAAETADPKGEERAAFFLLAKLLGREGLISRREQVRLELLIREVR